MQPASSKGLPSTSEERTANERLGELISEAVMTFYRTLVLSPEAIGRFLGMICHEVREGYTPIRPNEG